ncbi:hypothetical protein C8F04DRAFT_1093827 [Mycena alexandri]|uniref:Uncharacterized protein n=1 Tax=Mycena alexandri TaxID=1745969 RepID=A0AAD6T162_9AGAR|nr:hypothetical protein C8F04DRAFT_1093827 [Mycena alexandri]
MGPGAVDLAGNGWSRCKADDAFNTKIMLHIYLQITSNLEDYFLIDRIYFTITIGNARGDPPAGFLFIRPREDFRIGPTSFGWPNCPVYWSLDPEGAEVLSPEEAARLGFPSFQLATQVHGKCWDASVYGGLHKFHQAKGFDPDSQEVALHLGHPLYRLLSDVDAPFTHAEEISAEGRANVVSREGGPDGGYCLDQYAPMDGTGVSTLDESPIVSPGFRFIMLVQLVLIFFLSFFSLHEQVFGG